MYHFAREVQILYLYTALLQTIIYNALTAVQYLDIGFVQCCTSAGDQCRYDTSPNRWQDIRVCTQIFI